jgi:hypothetical protein
MKKLLSVATFVLLSFMFLVPMVSAGGGVEMIDMSVNKPTAVANGSDSIVLTVRFFRYQCATQNQAGIYPSVATYDLESAKVTCNTATGNPAVTGKVNVTQDMWVTNQGLQLSINGAVVNPDNGDGYYTNGLAYFTIKSTTVGQKTLRATATGHADPSWAGHDTITVNFTAPPVATSTTATKPVATQAPSADPSAPAVPAVTALKLGDQEVAPEQAPQQKVEVGKPLTFSGKTIPNGKVILTFRSETFTDTVTADANGDWSYTLSRDLGAGDHTMTVAVTDPATNKTSDPSQPVAFTLVAAEKTETPSVTNVAKNYTLWYLVGLGLVVSLSGALGFIIWKRKKNGKLPEQSLKQAQDQKSKE